MILSKEKVLKIKKNIHYVVSFGDACCPPLPGHKAELSFLNERTAAPLATWVSCTQNASRREIEGGCKTERLEMGAEPNRMHAHTMMICTRWVERCLGRSVSRCGHHHLGENLIPIYLPPYQKAAKCIGMASECEMHVQGEGD